jgi:hypothetical protein
MLDRHELVSRRGARARARRWARAAASVAVVCVAADAAGDGQWPSNVTVLAAQAGQPATATGDLRNGKTVDLAFASRSNVACFPATENVNFNGNHVFYALQMPKSTQMTITATPKTSTLDISLYAFTIGTTDFRQIPPDVTRATCEASYDAQTDSNPGKAESVKILSIQNPYNVVIGVAGANGTKQGQFDLKVEMVSTASTGSMTPLVATVVESKPNQTVTVTGDVSRGSTIDLGWATKSTTACFPATQNDNFQGKHVLYRTSIPKHSEMVISAVPGDPKLDISLYAYEVGSTDTTTVPPTMSRCVTCEASYDAQKHSNPGATETVKLNAIQNPYNVFIGVAGVKGVASGAFTLKIETKTKQ